MKKLKIFFYLVSVISFYYVYYFNVVKELMFQATILTTVYCLLLGVLSFMAGKFIHTMRENLFLRYRYLLLSTSIVGLLLILLLAVPRLYYELHLFINPDYYVAKCATLDPCTKETFRDDRPFNDIFNQFRSFNHYLFYYIQLVLGETAVIIATMYGFRLKKIKKPLEK